MQLCGCITTPRSLPKKVIRWYSYSVKLVSLQKPSRYINREINALYKESHVTVALAFPDIYEIGMSHLGLKILYTIINGLQYSSAERVYAPWTDREAQLRAENALLSSLESKKPLCNFDIVGFSLQYELSYTTVLNMLDLGGIPVRSADRVHASARTHMPLIIAGGPCTVNPAPMSPFIDAFLIGDGEEAVTEILEAFSAWKTTGPKNRDTLLKALGDIEGVFVPAVHDDPSPAGTFGNAIKRRFIQGLDSAPFPEKPIVPYPIIVHDRVNIEVSRGCTMGCRFCQAGIIYRPLRERSPERVLELAEKSLNNTGYEEIAFTSLSAGDYSCLLHVIREFNRRFSHKRISLSLPSLRVASVNRSLLREISGIRKTGFTIAPEAGTERLRRVINKDFSEADYEQALMSLFKEGWHNLKLYFMIGLPTETDEDIDAIFPMALKALKTAKRYMKRFVNINVGISPFVPKAHTPFQWYGQQEMSDLKRKKNHIKNMLLKKGLNVKSHDIEMSILEAAFSRGDVALAPLIEKAWELGCRLDGWTETFNFATWKTAMDMTGIDAFSCAQKSFAFSDILPWHNIDSGVSSEFLWQEYQNAQDEKITSDCRNVCHTCGIDCKEIVSFDNRGNGEGQPSERRNRETYDIAYPPSTRFKPVRIRVEYSKTGMLKVLSHRELMSVILRALRRADAPLVYSQGFHPSPKVSFGPPLGVGIAGTNEYFDVEVFPPFDLQLYIHILNRTLPEGIYINNMIVVPSQTESLSSFITRYEYVLTGFHVFPVHNFLKEKEILVQRKKASVNIRAMVEDVSFTDEKTCKLILVDQGKWKVRLGELVPALFDSQIEDLDITRVALYGWSGRWVKPIQKHDMQIVECRR